MSNTQLTISITSATPLEDISRAMKAGVDLIEIRLDHLTRPDCPALVRHSDKPLIWTLRHESEGGKFTGSIEEQIDRLIAAIDAGGEFVDIEFQRWRQAGPARDRLVKKITALRAAGRKIDLILSWHDFHQTPADLKTRVAQIADDPNGDIIKFACRAETIFDTFSIFDTLYDNFHKRVTSPENLHNRVTPPSPKNLHDRVTSPENLHERVILPPPQNLHERVTLNEKLHKTVKPLIAIGMDFGGAVTRILAGKFGGFLTFAAMEVRNASAPGQLTVEQMKMEYGVDRIGPATRLAGIVGHPVGHSLSPIMHNRAYKAMGFDGVYVKFDVPETYEDFCRFIEAIRSRPWMDVMGLSVTIPHKTHALRYLQENGAAIDPLAEKIGAVNTIVFGPAGALSGHNTDYRGVLETLRVQAQLPASQLKGKRTAVFGSGGVARAIVAAMTSVGAEVTIFNRTESKAQALAEEFGCRWGSWAEREAFEAEIFINGTSLGMSPEVERCPLTDGRAISPGCVVFDTVYNPLETKLLSLARSRGARAINGADMLVYQAVEQIKLWLPGQEKEEISIPADIMRTVVLSTLTKDRR